MNVEALILPVLGAHGVDGVITSIEAQTGETLDSNAIVMGVKVEDVIVKVPLTAKGVIEEFLVKVGDKVCSGQVYGYMVTVAEIDGKSTV